MIYLYMVLHLCKYVDILDSCWNLLLIKEYSLVGELVHYDDIYSIDDIIILPLDVNKSIDTEDLMVFMYICWLLDPASISYIILV